MPPPRPLTLSVLCPHHAASHTNILCVHTLKSQGQEADHGSVPSPQDDPPPPPRPRTRHRPEIVSKVLLLCALPLRGGASTTKGPQRRKGKNKQTKPTRILKLPVLQKGSTSKAHSLEPKDKRVHSALCLYLCFSS